MNPLVWLPEDALALRCPVEHVGTLRPDVEVLDASAPSAPVRQRMEAFALAQLARLATGDGRSAVDACRLLLERCPPVAPGGDAPITEWPDWMSHRRLAYQLDNDVDN